MDHQLSSRECTCRQTMKEVIYAEKKTRRGWYCAHCEKFEPAIGRERLLDRANQLHHGDDLHYVD